MSEEEKKAIEQEFQIALDNIVSKIKGETATAIVYSEQSMILLFRKLTFKIEKQQAEIEKLKIEYMNISKACDKDVEDLEKKDKIIDKMAEHLVDIIDNDDNASLLPFYDYEEDLKHKVLEYFTNKVEKKGE